MRNRKLTALIGVAMTGIFMISAMAQNTISPYSRFGYGLLGDNATSSQRQMGGIGYAMSSGRQINVMNPASYSRIDSLTFLFDIGADVSIINSVEDTARHRQSGGGLEYLTMQFPVSKKIGMSIGMLPFTSVGYAFGTKIDNGINQHQGTGGINQLYVGISGNVYKGLSVGANISYLFGNNTNDIYAYTSSGSTSVFEQTIQVKDWHLLLGAQYEFNISRTESIGLGLVFSPGKDLRGNAKVIKYAMATSGSNNTISPDTVQEMGLNKNFSLPSTFGVGVSYNKGTKILVEADFTYQPWSKAKFATMAEFPTMRFANRYKLALGGQFKPKDRGSYFELVNYRAGLSYNRDYMMVGSNNVREWTFACGLGLPTMSTKTLINIGFEYKKRQATPNPLLKESYFNIMVGINFNELWFVKRKIN